jgi:hypothetical protein
MRVSGPFGVESCASAGARYLEQIAVRENWHFAPRIDAAPKIALPVGLHRNEGGADR